MSRITAATELSRDELTDAPEEDWLNQKLEHDNQLGRQVVSTINQSLPILNSPTSQLVSLQLVHAASVTVKNPLSVPIKSVMAVACVGLSVDSTGKPNRGTYNLGLPQIEWHQSGKEDGSVIITTTFPSPVTAAKTISRTRTNATALTSPNALNVGTTTSIVLTPGLWRLSGGVGFVHTATTSITNYLAGVSATSATLPATDTTMLPTNGEVMATWSQPATVPNTGSGSANTVTLPTYEVDVAQGSTRELFLIARGIFTVAALSAFGYLEARYRGMPSGTMGQVTLFFAGGE